MGRLLSYSKSIYRQTYPEHEVYFNANIFIHPGLKVWYGDLDITLDKNTLSEIAKELKTDLYILREMDGHFNVFGPEAVEWENLKDKAVQVIKA
jgi:hypothetical protein